MTDNAVLAGLLSIALTARDFEAMGALELKGVSEPHEVFAPR